MTTRPRPPISGTRLMTTLSACIAAALAGNGCTEQSEAPDGDAASGTGDAHEPAAVDIRDPFIQRWFDITTDNTPAPPPEGSYGMDPDTGKFVHPTETPASHSMHPFPGQLDYWETESYASNMEVLAFYPEIVSPWHTWQTIADFDDQRIMYVYEGGALGIFDISDPTNMQTLYRHGSEWTADTGFQWFDETPPEKTMGAAVIQWDDDRDSYIMIQSYEVSRFTVITEDKTRQPDKVEQARHANKLKGLRIFAMHGPLQEDWELLNEVTTDTDNPDAPIGQQGGSGSLDIPAWFGGKYMFTASAPDASYGLTEYPTYLWSPGHQSWDMTDPANPVLLDQWAATGQIVGDAAHEAAYLRNPRAGNRTSWMGARMPLFIPRPVEDGGTVAYAAMGGLGFHVLDISDPADMKTLSHLSFPPSYAGTEGDNINVSQVERTGIVYFNGYPMGEDCYEPYKDIYIIDVNDPAKPEVLGTMPRPMPPAEAPYDDFCQRRGSFGPKRYGYHTQPGRWKQGVIPWAFYNAGVQVFDVSDAANPTIAAYFVPRFAPEAIPDYAQGNATYGIYVEYDRNIIWAFTSHGIYALTTPLLGEPLLSVPETPWPARN